MTEIRIQFWGTWSFAVRAKAIATALENEYGADIKIDLVKGKQWSIKMRVVVTDCWD